MNELLIVTEYFNCGGVKMYKNDVLQLIDIEGDKFYETLTGDQLFEIPVDEIMKYKDKLKPYEPFTEDDIKNIVKDKISRCSRKFRKSKFVKDYENMIISTYSDLPKYSATVISSTNFKISLFLN